MAEKLRPGTIFPTAHPEYSLTGDAIRQQDVQHGGVGTAPAPGEGGMLRYPTESPDAPRAAGSRVVWSAAGALAGVAVAMLGMKLARRR